MSKFFNEKELPISIKGVAPGNLNQSNGGVVISNFL
jgi:hypothetical protein